jgi:hypothetical protein
LQTLFQNDEDFNPASSEDSDKIDWPYRVWVVVAIAATVLAVFSKSHYELLAKIAWTGTGPGFTFSQTWNELHDLMSRAVFGALLLVHCVLMQVLFPFLPAGHYGYILVVAFAEIMTIGLAYQVWVHLRSSSGKLSRD